MNPTQRFLCINEFGVPTGAMAEVRRILESEWKGKGPRLEVLMFGACDLVTLDATSDIRFLAVNNSKGPVSYQRSFGAAFLDRSPPGDVYGTSDEVLSVWPEKAFVAICQLKVDPLVNLLCGDIFPSKLFDELDGFLKLRFEAFRTHVDELRNDPQRPWLVPLVDAWLEESANDLSSVRILPLAGLDSAEVILVLRCANLNTLGRVIWALRSLRMRHLHLETAPDLRRRIEADARTLQILGEHERSFESIEHLPVWSYSSTAVGLPCALVDDEARLPNVPVCQRALLSVRMRSMPGRALVSEEQLQEFDTLFARGDPTRENHLPTRFTVLGSYDLMYPAGGSVKKEEATGEDGASIVSVKQTLDPPQEYTLREIAGALRDPVQPHSRGYLQETTIALRVFPPGLRRADLLADPEIARFAQTDASDRFESVLAQAQARWLGEYHTALKDAFRRQRWPYSETNGALNLVVSLVTLLTDRLEMENYIELLPPLDAWRRAVVAPVQSKVDVHRTYKNLDRVMHARSHRESPYHPPGVSRSFEARAGYVLPRDAFHAYLNELARLRLSDEVAVLLVDGTDGQLLVKHAGRVSIFFVSALRLQNPLLWPSVAHEVEHARYRNTHVNGSAQHRCRELFASWRGSEELISYGRPQEILSRLFAHPDASWASEDRWFDSFRNRAHQEFVQVACDVAILDSGALGSPESHGDRVMRLVATSMPNLVMDIHGNLGHWSAPADARDVDDLEWAHRLLMWSAVDCLGMRLASVLALLSFGHEKQPSPDELRGELRRVLSGDPWRAMLEEIICLALSERGHTSSEWPRPSAEVKRLAGGTKGTLNSLLLGDLWIRALQLVHALRLPSPPSDAVTKVASYLAGLVENAGWAAPADVSRSIFPRGGLDPDCPAARESSTYAFYDGLRDAIRRLRLGTTSILLHTPLMSTR